MQIRFPEVVTVNMVAQVAAGLTKKFLEVCGKFSPIDVANTATIGNADRAIHREKLRLVGNAGRLQGLDHG